MESNEAEKKYYVGVKIVQAWPEDMDGEPGYAVIYSDGYKSWSPMDVFQKSYYLMGEENFNAVTTEMVDDFVLPVIITQLDQKTVQVKTEMLNGFVDYQTASCVDPEKFNARIGADVCKKKTRDKIFELLGFVVQWGFNGLKG